MNDSRVIIEVGFGCLVAGGVLIWHFTRAHSLLESWARENGYELLESSYRNVIKGPFFWTSSRGQVVYRITVRDARGRTRSGWLRCGGWWAGLFSDKTEVRWDSELNHDQPA